MQFLPDIKFSCLIFCILLLLVVSVTYAQKNEFLLTHFSKQTDTINYTKTKSIRFFNETDTLFSAGGVTDFVSKKFNNSFSLYTTINVQEIINFNKLLIEICR